MISNFHTHTTFSDGENTPEEVVLTAIDNGFASIGFSDHGYTDFDLTYCMKNTAEYISEINRLKEVYKDKIQIYLGVEEDASYYINRSDFDYIIGSSHYCLVEGIYYPIDSNPQKFQNCFSKFDFNPIKMAHAYYGHFCRYIRERKPDIVGHFDLITKFDEQGEYFFLENKEYTEIAQRYISDAAQSGCFFEVNTGAISRGYRSTAYPYENLLYILKKNGNGIVLSSDSHNVGTLSFKFDDMRCYLKDLSFRYVYHFYNGQFVKDYL